jgi:ADP-ribosyl-[dinitrogen reductase] hydrolase
MVKSADKWRGILLGLAIGDALGTTLEFGPRRALDHLHTELTGGGVFRLAAGEWTDDTAMAVGLGRSLVAENAFEPLKVLHEWAEWYRTGKHSCNGRCFDIGGATRAALAAYLADPTKVPQVAASALGNGSLMRLAPVVLFARDEVEAESLGYRQSVLTHGEEAAKATGWFARLLFWTAASGWDASVVASQVAGRSREQVSASGFYRDTLEAALWAVANTRSFEEALVAAVNLGDDADTVGAVTGQLAGAVYGESTIPARWLERLAWREELCEMADQLIAR